MKSTIAQLFGVATADCLTDSEYNRALRIITDNEFWRRLEHFCLEFVHFHYHYYLFDELYHYFRTRYLREEGVSLSEDILLCQLWGLNIGNVIPQFPYLYPLPFPYLSSKFVERIMDILREFNIKPDHFSLSLKIRTSALLVPDRVRISLKEIYEYHVPFGQSPETESETLKNIIKQAKSIVVAPLVAGAMSSATLLSTGQYVLAIECTLASSASTIVLVATTSLADRILDHLSKRRGTREE